MTYFICLIFVHFFKYLFFVVKEIERLEQGQKRRPNTNMVNLSTMPTNANVTHAKTKVRFVININLNE